MEKTISAADANRRFSEILRGVREGDSYVVTNHGHPVARIVPAETADPKKEAARAALLERLRRQPLRKVEPWTRDELYEDEPCRLPSIRTSSSTPREATMNRSERSRFL